MMPRRRFLPLRHAAALTPMPPRFHADDAATSRRHAIDAITFAFIASFRAAAVPMRRRFFCVPHAFDSLSILMIAFQRLS
jgi:hypothetical protein